MKNDNIENSFKKITYQYKKQKRTLYIDKRIIEELKRIDKQKHYIKEYKTVCNKSIVLNNDKPIMYSLIMHFDSIIDKMSDNVYRVVKVVE